MRKLSVRQREVVELIELGYDTADIAEALDLSRNTVKGKVKRLCRRYRCGMLDLPAAVAEREAA